ncbi:hypothetical protein PUN28_003269 [Cardiocondyla obscurior]|uniref:Uncharacterized protein n=1 Tax=Cardiocondyla obscurior TaxID=286306 RepID=A0AAW2GNH2_9HYME
MENGVKKEGRRKEGRGGDLAERSEKRDRGGRRTWTRRSKGRRMQHIRGLCTGLAEHAKDRVKLDGDIIERPCSEMWKRRARSESFVATVAICNYTAKLRVVRYLAATFRNVKLDYSPCRRRCKTRAGRRPSGRERRRDGGRERRREQSRNFHVKSNHHADVIRTRGGDPRVPHGQN